jgi:hypothetical protein
MFLEIIFSYGQILVIIELIDDHMLIEMGALIEDKNV